MYRLKELIIDYFDIAIARLMIWRIKSGYGCYCKTKDIDDFAGEDISKSRCPSCKATEVVDWLEDHIKLIREFI